MSEVVCVLVSSILTLISIVLGFVDYFRGSRQKEDEVSQNEETERLTRHQLFVTFCFIVCILIFFYVYLTSGFWVAIKFYGVEALAVFMALITIMMQAYR